MAASLTWTSVDASVFAAEPQDISKDIQGKAQVMAGSEGVTVGQFIYSR